MLAPKTSLKQLLLGMVFLAIVLGLVSMAVRGSMLAVGLSIAILILPLLFGFYALIYVVLASLVSNRMRRHMGNMSSNDDPQRR